MEYPRNPELIITKARSEGMVGLRGNRRKEIITFLLAKVLAFCVFAAAGGIDWRLLAQVGLPVGMIPPGTCSVTVN